MAASPCRLSRVRLRNSTVAEASRVSAINSYQYDAALQSASTVKGTARIGCGATANVRPSSVSVTFTPKRRISPTVIRR